MSGFSEFAPRFDWFAKRVNWLVNLRENLAAFQREDLDRGGRLFARIARAGREEIGLFGRRSHASLGKRVHDRRL
ncbi:MAG: hypothetical protein ACK6CE_01075 [Planctomycetota bacterium]